MSVAVSLLGGPHARRGVVLLSTPPAIHVGQERYERIDDPDTGKFLGGYAWAGRLKPVCHSRT